MAQDPPKKKPKTKTKQAPELVRDTTTVSVVQRGIQMDSISLEQKRMLKELDELIEKQEKAVKR